MIFENREKENNWNFHFPSGVRDSDNLRLMYSTWWLLARAEQQVLASRESWVSESWVYTRNTWKLGSFSYRFPGSVPKYPVTWSGMVPKFTFPSVSQVPLLLLSHLHLDTTEISLCCLCPVHLGTSSPQSPTPDTIDTHHYIIIWRDILLLVSPESKN